MLMRNKKVNLRRKMKKKKIKNVKSIKYTEGMLSPLV